MDREALIRGKTLFLFDMDGTLYLGERLYPFTLDLLRTIRETGRNYLFVTNNSSKSVSAYVEKLARLGIDSREEDFLTSSQATAWYLHRELEGKTLYVCGTRSLTEELTREGFAVTTRPEEAQAVVMGFDTELTFQKLHDVSWLLLTCPDIPYIATNPDLVCPTEFGSVPDCGSVCQMLKNVSGRTPTVIGKPSPLMVELALEKQSVPRERACVVGDRIYTDVKSALNAGVTGILVMSGETTPDILAASPDRPDLVLRDGGEILDILRKRSTV